MEERRFRLTFVALMIFAFGLFFFASSVIAANTYISDFPFDGTPVNGWNGGPKLDEANGDPGVPLNPITLHGTVYPKGLGVHAYSLVTYNLGGQYSTFDSYVGVDDEVVPQGGGGSVVFQLVADGVKLFDSGIMTHDSPTQHVTVDVTGKNLLQLIVNVGNTLTNDHADWAGAFLSTPLASSVHGYVTDHAGVLGWGGQGFSVSKLQSGEYAIAFNPPIAGGAACTVTPFYFTAEYESASPIFCVYQPLSAFVNTDYLGVTCFLSTSTPPQVTSTNFSFFCQD